MASVASWHPLFLRHRTSHFTTTTSNNTGINICRKSYLQCHNKEQEPQQEQVQEEKSVFGMQCLANRRQVLLGTTFAAFSLPEIYSKIALAENDDFRVFTDDVNKFQISIPLDWQVGAGEPSGFKSVTAFYPEEGFSSISVVITGLGPDFTKIESFGKVDEFAETLVSGLDRSWQRPAGVAAKLIDCKSSKGLYFIEYSLQKPGESIKHLYSALGMTTNGWYNRLYTITGQFGEEESDKYRSKIEKAVKSFKFI